jgi:TfoX-like protein
MAVDELFDRAARRLLEEDPELEQGRMFSAVGLKTAGRFFAMVTKGDLVVKLPAERVEELVTEGAGRQFEVGGRRMREWVSLRPRDDAACAAFMVEARGFVRSG